MTTKIIANIIALIATAIMLAIAAPAPAAAGYGDLITMNVHDAPRDCAAFWTATIKNQPGTDYSDRAAAELEKIGVASSNTKVESDWLTIFRIASDWSNGQWNVVNRKCQIFAG